MTFVESRRGNVKALILTHGHEDHIGAVPHVMPLFDGPVYGRDDARVRPAEAR
jgi:ribonuclease J